MTQHTPVKIQTCHDCKVLSTYYILLCPLHAAAPAMLALIKRNLEALEEYLEGPNVLGADELAWMYDARAALRKATGA